MPIVNGIDMGTIGINLSIVINFPAAPGSKNQIQIHNLNQPKHGQENLTPRPADLSL